MKIINKHCLIHLKQELNSKNNCEKCQGNLRKKKSKNKTKNEVGSYEYNRRNNKRKYSIIIYNKNQNKDIQQYYQYLITFDNLKKENCINKDQITTQELTINQKLLASFSNINIFNKKCNIHKCYLINYFGKEEQCLGCLQWKDNFCHFHKKEITQKNRKCKECIRIISDKRIRKTNEIYKARETLRLKKRQKGNTKELVLDLETTTDPILEKLIPKYDKDLNKISENKIRQAIGNNTIKTPEIYIATICHIEKYGNLTQQEIIENKEEILSILQETNNFNAKNITHCNTKSCQWKNISHWRYSFYNEKHLALFLLNFCLSSNIWTQNGAKFDNSFIKRLFDRNKFKQFYEYDFGSKIYVIENHFTKILANEKLSEEEKDKINIQYFVFKKEVLIWKKMFHKKEEEFYQYYDKLPSKKQKTTNKEKWIKKNWKKNIDLNKHYYISRDGKNRYMRFIIYGNQFYDTQKNKKHVKRNRSINFCDINLIFTSSLKQKGEDLAKVYLKKGMKDANYWFLKKEIANQHKQYFTYQSNQEMLNSNQGKDLDYAYTDVFILMMFLVYLNDEYKLNYRKWELTAGATAYKTFVKEYTKIEAKINSEIKVIIINKKTNYYKYQYKNKIYEALQLGKILLEKKLPTKWIKKEIHNHIRQWYRGGITMVNELYRGVLVQNATYIDINSSYPNVMNSVMFCPISEGININKNLSSCNLTYDKFISDYKKKNKIDNVYMLLTLDILQEITNEKGLPFVTDSSGLFIDVKLDENNQPITKFDELAEKNAQYLKKLKPKMKILIDSNEYERFIKYYNNEENINYTITINWIFNASTFKNIFGNFIDQFFAMKEEASKNSNLAIKIWAKLFLNSLYGKFASKFMMKSKVVIRTNEYDIEHENEKKFYLPIGSAITAGARMSLVDACGYSYHKFVYCDTDSMIIITNDINKDFPNIKLDKYKLGYWDIEAENLIGIVRRAKQYLFINTKTGKIKSAFAGFKTENEYLYESENELTNEWNKELSITFTDMITGKLVLNQIYNYATPDYTMLYNHDKILQHIANYPPLFEQTRCFKEDYKKTLKSIKFFESKWMKENNIEFWTWVRQNNKLEDKNNKYFKIECEEQYTKTLFMSNEKVTFNKEKFQLEQEKTYDNEDTIERVSLFVKKGGD